MGESCMGRTGENQFGKAELPDAPKALEGLGLDDLPQRLLEWLGIKLDQVMERVANTLGFR